jgi:hypothetical protein
MTAAMITVRPPVWYTAAFAMAVFAGILGALGLVLARHWARPLLVVSLVAMIVQFAWWTLISGAAELYGPAVYVAPVVVIVVSALLVWLANAAVRRGWLG